MNWETIIQLVGVSGFGVGIWAIIDKWIQNNLDKKKFLYKEKLEAFSLLSKNIIGFGLYGKFSKDVFNNFADSAKARLLIKNKELDKKIHNFFVKLDLKINSIEKEIKNKNNENENENDKKWSYLQKESLEILDALKKDLDNTL